MQIDKSTSLTHQNCKVVQINNYVRAEHILTTEYKARSLARLSITDKRINQTKVFIIPKILLSYAKTGQ